MTATILTAIRNAGFTYTTKRMPSGATVISVDVPTLSEKVFDLLTALDNLPVTVYPSGRDEITNVQAI